MPPSLAPEYVLAAIMSSTEGGLLSFSLDGTIQSWSRAAEQLYGYAAAEITGQPVSILLPICEMPATTARRRAFHRAASEHTPANLRNARLRAVVAGRQRRNLRWLRKCRAPAERWIKNPRGLEAGCGSRRNRRGHRNRGDGQSRRLADAEPDVR